MKEAILRRAWKVLKKRGEYTEAKKVLKEKRIKFQTPYPARMRCFTIPGWHAGNDGYGFTRISSLCAETAYPPDEEEIRLLSAWKVMGRQED